MGMLAQAILLGLLGIFANLEWFFGTCYIQRPIILGTLTGLIMGDLHQGIIMGATMELAFAGASSIGAYDPPDMISGTVLGVAFAIHAGGSPEMALTLGLPIATIMLGLSNVTGYPILQAFAHILDRNVAKGDDKAFQRNFILSGIVAWDCLAWVIPVAYYFGSDKISSIIGGLPEFVSTGIDIAGGLLPAMGFAMLAQMIMKKNVGAFFFIGYFIIAYSGASSTAVALFVILALVALYLFFPQGIGMAEQKETVTKDDLSEGGGFDEF
jgi:fructoselysine/glucoselysine PTS system EIIC component